MDKRRDIIKTYTALSAWWTIVTIFAVFLYKLHGTVQLLAFVVWGLHVVFISVLLYQKRQLQMDIEYDDYKRSRREAREKARKEGRTDDPDWV